MLFPLISWIETYRIYLKYTRKQNTENMRPEDVHHEFVRDIQWEKNEIRGFE